MRVSLMGSVLVTGRGGVRSGHLRAENRRPLIAWGLTRRARAGKRRPVPRLRQWHGNAGSWGTGVASVPDTGGAWDRGGERRATVGNYFDRDDCERAALRLGMAPSTGVGVWPLSRPAARAIAGPSAAVSASSDDASTVP